MGECSSPGTIDLIAQATRYLYVLIFSHNLPAIPLVGWQENYA